MASIRHPSTLLFLLVLLLCWVAIRFDVTPAAVNDNPADTTFHVSNALARLQQIATEPHSLGTAANDRVRRYIDSACQSLGLEVRELPFTVILPETKGVVVAQGVNIAATLHGTSSADNADNKKVLVMAHFDSEPNALGAGDDGSACAAMLESMRALRAGAPLTHDILFLFTNGEENGLLGAEAFTRDPTLLTDIGMVLNFDGRGDAGKCLMFRTSPDNDWVVREYARAPIHHGAGSLYSELFKLLPNNTDFSPLQNTGIPGLDFAFAEGFVHYHNLTDNVENIDKRMMQEQGDNMLGSIRHFGRLDLHHPPVNSLVSNTTYFNLLGNILIHYPLTTNFVLLLLTNVLVLFALVVGFYRKTIRVTQALIGLIIFPVTLAVLYFLASWSWDAVRSAWPLYIGYYPNAYNGYYFYLALAAEALAVFALIYQWPLRKWSMAQLFVPVLVWLTILVDVLYKFIPAGVYFLYFPLIGAAILAAFLPQRAVPRLLAALAAILWLAPLIYSLAVLFDTEPEAAMVAPVTGLLMGLLIPVFTPSLCKNPWFIPGFAAIIMVVAVGLGILHGSYSPDKPLKTDLRYVAQPDEHQAWWASRAGRPDRWNRSFFTQSSLRPTPYRYPLAARPINELSNPAPLLDLPAPSLFLTKDSLADGHRRLYLHCQPAPHTTTIHISFSADHPAGNIAIAGDNIPGPLGWMEYEAPPDQGFDVIITCAPGAPFTIDLTGRTMGLPAAAGFHGYPEDVIPTAASYANTTMVQRSYIFR